MFLSIHSSRSGSRRRGAANRAIVALSASACVLVLLVLLLGHRPRQSAHELTIYCAAGLREPMEAIRAAYEKEHGAHLTIQYGGSSTLLGNLRLNHDANLFLPADESYIEIAKADGLVTETFPIAQMRPVFAVKKGNPLGIRSFDDLLTKDIRISMTDPSAAATGKLVQEAFERAGKWDAFKGRIAVFKATVSEVAADLQVGAVDAGIIWDAMLKQLPEFEEAPLPDLAGVIAHVVASLTIPKNRQGHSARALADYLAAPDKGQHFFVEAGFSPP